MKVQVNKMFDIDKLNIYWAKDTENKIFGSLTEDDLFEKYTAFNDNAIEQGEEPISFEDYKLYYKSGPDRFLLELEKSILLHPRNAHHLLMPLTDEIFVQDIYNNMLKEGLINKPQSSYFSSLLPSTNVKNTVIFVKGKYGVGPVALGITGMATNQADTLDIAEEYSTQDREVRPTKLLFKGMGDRYNLDSYVDLNGVVISETNSQLLTTQVDNVKNPTAVLMNINMQTLGVLNYLIRRGVSPQSAILLLNQPLVKAYLSAQKLNESLFNKNIKRAELSKSKLITKLLLDSGYPMTVLPDVFDQPDAFVLDDSKMLAAAKSGKLDNEQLLYLSYFVNDLQPQARAFSDFQQSQTSDTKGLKDRQAWDEAQAIEDRVSLSEIVKPIDVARINSRGVIAPFYQYGRRNYNIFRPFYSLVNSVFGEDLLDLKNAAAERMAGLDKDRVRQTIENDFILYLIHKFVTNKQEFDRLTKGNSVAKRVQDLKTKIPSNLVLKAFLPMLKNTVDNTTNETIDNLRLFEKDLSALDSNDLRLSMEEIADLDMELYKDIVKLLMFQSGLNTSILNYSSIVPVGLNSKRDDLNQYMYVYQDLLQDAMKALKKDTNNTKMFAEFKLLFAANNPKFLSTNPQYPGVFPLARVWMREQEKEVLMNKNMVQAQLGDAYHKQYFPELIDLQKMDVSKKAQDSNNDKTIEDKPVISSEYELFPGVYANEGQKEALNLLKKFLNSNEKEFTLIGRGGTGKTTIIKKILENYDGEFKGITVAHKAKKVLGKSIGKDRVKTVASALAIKLDESTGIFTPDLYAREHGRVPVKHLDLIIVDEASMISPKIYEELMSLKKPSAKVIFMGDNAQLPPVGESEDSPVFNNKNQYTLKEKMRQAKTSPIINIGSTIAENIESSNPKTVAIKSEDRKSKFDDTSKSEVRFISDESKALDLMVEDIRNAKNNPDFVKAITFNNENHNSSQSVKNLNIKIREKLWGKDAKNQFNIGEILTAYDRYSKDIGADEDLIPLHNGDDVIVKDFSIHNNETGTVRVFSQAKGERTFSYKYDIVYLELLDNEGESIPGIVVPVIANSSKTKYDADLADLWKTDKQLAFALKKQFANLQYGYAITSHKALGSTYTNAYVFEDNILGPTSAGDNITKNKSLYVAVSRPTTKLVMISERNGDQVSQPVQPTKEVPKVTSAVKTLPMQPDISEKPITPNVEDYTNHSGGAYGADTFWDIIGREFGVTNHKHYRDSNNQSLSKQLRNKGIKAEIISKEEMTKARNEVEKLLNKKYPDTIQGNLQVRNYYQVANSDSVFAIAKLNNQENGVEGGTNTAIQLGIKLNKPVYVWDINFESWTKYSLKTNQFEPIGRPTLTKDFAGVGTRDIENYSVQNKETGFWESRQEYVGKEKEEKAKKAIRDVYENTFGKISDNKTSLTTSFEEQPNVQLSEYKFTPDNITSLKPNEIFVFGSNTQGRHGFGAAKTAMSFGAKYNQAEGLQGQTYAIITKDLTKPKDEQLKSVPLEKIGKGIQDMLLYAKANQDKTFLVTKLGSSLAGYTVEEIAGLFKRLEKFIPDNVILPQEYDPRQKTVEKPSGKPSSINIYSTDKNGYQKLSNLADREFTDKDGRKYYSVEHAYQSWKSGSFDEETYKKYTKGGVKIPGNKGTKTENNWNINLMKRLIRLSLEQNPDLMDLLVGTGNIPLTHTQDNTIWKTEFPKILMELRDEFKSGYQSLFDADRGQSQYSPSLKMYEGFINLNQLYQGDEILPFIGESEYYRYLVPMLLKMNPKAQTMFTHHMKYFAREIGMQKNMDLDFFNSLNNTSIGGDAGGIAVREIDSSFVRPDEPVKSLVHELVHLTLQKEYEKGTEFKQKIDELYKYAWDKQITDGTYGFTSPKEFLAEAMSNPDFMQELNEIQYGDETVWSYLMTLVSDFINKLLNIELKSDSVLAAVVRASEQVLQHNITELSKESEINPSEIQKDILENWTSYFPQYEWMNDQQKQITAQLVEEGKLTLHCKI